MDLGGFFWFENNQVKSCDIGKWSEKIIQEVGVAARLDMDIGIRGGTAVAAGAALLAGILHIQSCWVNLNLN